MQFKLEYDFEDAEDAIHSIAMKTVVAAALHSDEAMGKTGGFFRTWRDGVLDALRKHETPVRGSYQSIPDLPATPREVYTYAEEVLDSIRSNYGEIEDIQVDGALALLRSYLSNGSVDADSVAGVAPPEKVASDFTKPCFFLASEVHSASTIVEEAYSLYFRHDEPRIKVVVKVRCADPDERHDQDWITGRAVVRQVKSYDRECFMTLCIPRNLAENRNLGLFYTSSHELGVHAVQQIDDIDLATFNPREYRRFSEGLVDAAVSKLIEDRASKVFGRYTQGRVDAMVARRLKRSSEAIPAGLEPEEWRQILQHGEAAWDVILGISADHASPGRTDDCGHPFAGHAWAQAAVLKLNMLPIEPKMRDAIVQGIRAAKAEDNGDVALVFNLLDRIIGASDRDTAHRVFESDVWKIDSIVNAHQNL